ncbi:hypothetical protein LSH36_121g04052 [Paralvinella palmiformis]|uniref:Solute carrier family 23 member 2 n=1 Tax=Paralvinella palmiformis TaxID=53620 RepID=A0AAD9NAJ6_9ANNE|nr:hypothetical protein LSH36_121g04052 [Paralvinella palmiformis]
MPENLGYVAEDIIKVNGTTTDKIEINERNSSDNKRTKDDLGLLYSITETPPWYLCILLGLQHYLTAFGAILSIPLIIAPAFCIGSKDVGTGEILSTLIFVSGIVTILQTTFGTSIDYISRRSYSVRSFAVSVQWFIADYSNTTLYNDSQPEDLADYKEELWHSRIREIQGAIILSSIFQVVVGVSGILGIMLKFIGPLAIAPTIALVGVSLFIPAANACQVQWGTPTFSVAGVFGMLAGVIAGMIESLGDYYACARISGAPPPPVHAVNRGITIEGIGCILSGMWGSGCGTTSYSENIGAIGITKVTVLVVVAAASIVLYYNLQVGSRVVIQTAGILMICLGMLAKFGALFVTIPSPIIGGVFMVTFGMITAVGISNLQYVNMNSSRNLFIFGFSLFFGLSMPQWMATHQEAVNTGVAELDQILTVLLSTSMFVGGTVGFILDNIIPGTEEERGIKAWRAILDQDDKDNSNVSIYKCYDLPWCMGCFHRVKCFRYWPISPTFNYSPSCSCHRKGYQSERISPDGVVSSENPTNVITAL